MDNSPEEGFQHKIGAIGRDLQSISGLLATMPGQCHQQRMTYYSWHNDYLGEDEHGRVRTQLSPDAPKCLLTSFQLPPGRVALSRDDGNYDYMIPSGIVDQMRTVLKVVGGTPEGLLRTETFNRQHMAPEQSHLLQICASLAVRGPRGDEYITDMNRFRLTLLRSVEDALPDLKACLVKLRNRIVVDGELPTADYYDPNRKEHQSLRKIFKDHVPVEDQLQSAIETVDRLQTRVKDVCEHFWALQEPQVSKAQDPGNRIAGGEHQQDGVLPFPGTRKR